MTGQAKSAALQSHCQTEVSQQAKYKQENSGHVLGKKLLIIKSNRKTAF